jgi:hypothetical protein
MAAVGLDGLRQRLTCRDVIARHSIPTFARLQPAGQFR